MHGTPLAPRGKDSGLVREQPELHTNVETHTEYYYLREHSALPIHFTGKDRRFEPRCQ